MSLHFSKAEMARRQKTATDAIGVAGYDAILLFAPESQYWLTGYDTFGFAMFQCMVLTKTGDIHLLTRLPDLRQAWHTSTLTQSQVHVWPEAEGNDPTAELEKLLAQLGVASASIAAETETAGLNYSNGAKVSVRFPKLIADNDLMRNLRRVKSAEEIAMHRKAAKLSDDALLAGVAATKPGAFEGDILADMQGAVFRGGGDYAGNEFIIGSGEGALLCRYFSGRRHLDAKDQLTLEWSGTYARYHAAMMQTLVTGSANAAQRKMHDTCREALEACEAAIRPGAPMGDVFEAHTAVFDRNGFQASRLQACGYGMGAVFNPIWVEFPMFYEGNPLIMQTGQVFFLHMILMDGDAGQAMCLGHSVLVSDDGVERLSGIEPQLFDNL